MGAMASQITSIVYSKCCVICTYQFEKEIIWLQPFIQVQIKENIKLRVTDLCEGNSRVTGEFPSQRASDVENVSKLMTSSC